MAAGLSAVGLACGLATVAASEGKDQPLVSSPPPQAPAVAPREVEQIDQEVDVAVPVPQPPQRGPGAVPSGRAAAAAGPPRSGQTVPGAGKAAAQGAPAAQAAQAVQPAQAVQAAPAPKAAAAPAPKPTAVSTGSQPR